jgi:hypothetical protein
MMGKEAWSMGAVEARMEKGVERALKVQACGARV